MKDFRERGDHPRERGKKKLFSPGSRTDPLSSIFKGSRRDFPEVAERRPTAASLVKPPTLPPAPRRDYKLLFGIDPIVLFAAYHLGVTEKNEYRPQNIHDLARRFRISPAQINEALTAYDLDAQTVMNTDFDIGMAQIDIKVAPQGISKMELARQLYEDFRSSPRVNRNWRDEIEKDAEENKRIFEKLK